MLRRTPRGWLRRPAIRSRRLITTPLGWLSSLSTTLAGGSATSLLDTIGYSGAGGAAGHATSANVAGGTYSSSSSYDADTRLSSLSLTNVSTSSVLFRSQRGYDAASNVTAVNTTLAAGTDNQAFCYDEQNRLVWAGSQWHASCGASLTAGTLECASYTQTFAYDTLDRLTSGPLGSYTYGDSAHLHAVTSIGSGAHLHGQLRRGGRHDLPRPRQHDHVRGTPLARNWATTTRDG